MSGSSREYHFFKGRVALYAILKALGVGPGDEVIMPGFTCVVVPNAVRYLGAKPVFIDVDPLTYNIDPEMVSSTEGELWHEGRAKALIAQHTFGIPADMDALSSIAERHGMALVEDSCHAIGSRYKGREVGTIGEAAFFSSQWSKPVTTGLGGWAVVNDPALAEKMDAIYPGFHAPSLMETLRLRLQHFTYALLFKPSLFWFARGAYRKLSGLGLALGSSSADELRGELPPEYEKSMSRWQKDLLMLELGRMDDMIAHRRSVTAAYEEILKEIGIGAVQLPGGYDPVYLRYPISVSNRDGLLTEAERMRVEIGDWFVSPVHPLTERLEIAGYRAGSCPNAEELCRKVVNLPTHERVSMRDVERIGEFLKKNC